MPMMKVTIQAVFPSGEEARLAASSLAMAQGGEPGPFHLHPPASPGDLPEIPPGLRGRPLRRGRHHGHGGLPPGAGSLCHGGAGGPGGPAGGSDFWGVGPHASFLLRSALFYLGFAFSVGFLFSAPPDFLLKSLLRSDRKSGLHFLCREKVTKSGRGARAEGLLRKALPFGAGRPSRGDQSPHVPPCPPGGGVNLRNGVEQIASLRGPPRPSPPAVRGGIWADATPWVGCGENAF